MKGLNGLQVRLIFEQLLLEIKSSRGPLMIPLIKKGNEITSYCYDFRDTDLLIFIHSLISQLGDVRMGVNGFRREPPFRESPLCLSIPVLFRRPVPSRQPRR